MKLKGYDELIEWQIKNYTDQINIILKIVELKGYWKNHIRAQLQYLTKYQEITLLLNLDKERGDLIQHRDEIIQEWMEYYTTVHEGIHVMKNYFTEINSIRKEYLSNEYYTVRKKQVRNTMKIYNKPTDEHYIKGKKHKQAAHNATHNPVYDGLYMEYKQKQKKRAKNKKKVNEKIQ
ncbi:hypothetical protein [Methanosphaera sp.]|uniref:hypothetical protein n=1 Tax=Methanosphaera sp. TaxID=2666342 RepID=UPI003D8A5B6F